jgi:PAS domain S-box-containing protein
MSSGSYDLQSRLQAPVLDNEYDDDLGNANDDTITKEQKRKKHNEMEVKRRMRIQQKINELQQVCHCPRNDRRSILQTAIDTINGYTGRIAALEAEIARLRGERNSPSPPIEQQLQHNIPQQLDQGQRRESSGLDFQAVFENVSGPMAIVSLDGRILHCNVHMCNVFGKGQEELQSRTIFQLCSPNDAALLFSKVKTLCETGMEVVIADTTAVYNSGEVIPMVVLIYSVRDQDHSPSYLYWVGIPTT